MAPEDPLWAPWRLEYILGPKDGTCIFCHDPGVDRRAALIVHIGELAQVMLNKYPYNSGHILVAPLTHKASLEDLTTEESAEIFSLLKDCTRILGETISPEGFNVGLNLGKAAGAGVADHLHFHVVPRWNGDTNFMAVAADVRVVPEHIDATYDKLLPYFSKLKP